MINRAFLCSVLLVTVVSGIEELRPGLQHNPRIVGGFQIAIADAPYQVSLQFRQKHFCGGSIISPKWVLTAAQCTVKATASQLQVRVGSTRHADGGTVIPVKKIVQHPDYNSGTHDYDFSLLELQRVILMGKKSMAIMMPDQGSTPAVLTRSKMSGWGSTKSGQEYSDTLQIIRVTVFYTPACHEIYASYGGLTDRMFCAGYLYGGKDARTGDFGGPLVADGKLIGVISWNVECGQIVCPIIYAGVGAIRDWIRGISGV